MRTHTILLSSIVAAALLTGCKDEDQNHTVEHFSAHPAERRAMLETCEVSDQSMDDANCVNAREAARKSQTDKDRDGFDNVFGAPSFD
ncbi:MAG: EexN family lipoprotein [Rhodobacterales bacterium]|nr:EexN family lipoprotein [Puniceibacterium antarcticum]